MTAFESAELIKRSQQAVAFMEREITRICCDIPKRSPGSEGERKAAEYMAGVLKDRCGCEPLIESFREHPG